MQAQVPTPQTRAVSASGAWILSCVLLCVLGLGLACASGRGSGLFHTVQRGQRPTIFMPLFELGFGEGAGALGIADFSNARRDEYHTVDLRIGIEAERWALTAFGANLTDEKYLEEVIPAPEFGGSFNHPGSQRRYGVEFSVNF